MLAVGSSAGCVDKPTESRVRASALLRAGQAEKALAECDGALKEAPGDASLLILRAKALFELERYQDARGSYLRALETATDRSQRAEAHLGLAMVAMRGKDYQQARQQFAKLVKVNPKSADARINLARVCLQLKKLDCAIEHGEQAGRLRGNDEAILFTLGRIYLVANKHSEAKRTFQRICEVLPKAASCPYGLALVAAQQGDKARALTKLRQAIALELPNVAKLAEDPLLAPLKNDPAFKQLSGKN